MARDDGRDHQEEERLPLQRSYEHANAKHRALHQGGRRWQGSRRLSLRTLLPPVSVVCRSHDGCCLFASSPRLIDPRPPCCPHSDCSSFATELTLSLPKHILRQSPPRTTKRRRTLALMVTDNYMQHAWHLRVAALRGLPITATPLTGENKPVAAGGPHGACPARN